MGIEHKLKGVNVALGPMMNLGRVAEGGRNWEGFGADPFLAGEASYETILGMQESGIVACAKHLVGKYVRSPAHLVLPLIPTTANRSSGGRNPVRTLMIERCMSCTSIHS